MTTESVASSQSTIVSSDAGSQPLLMENLTKCFAQGDKRVLALNGVSAEVNQSEFVAIMGASGSGKSTLLNLIAGITQPDQGRVLIDGTEITSLRDPALTRFRRRKIGLVFQSFNLIPTLTARDNILLPVLAGGEQGPLSVNELLERIGLQDRATHRPDALSGGEQQRIAIARALISDPALLLADEPTGSLDSVTSQTICRLMKELRDDLGRTVIVVTHEPDVAMWADRVIVLRDGQKLTEFETKQFPDAQALAAFYQETVLSSGSGAEIL
ncbi:putative ABC transporter ATP-binding protein [Gimesia maris]|nr:ABC transporter ATP-binding protein [Gimesia maris]QDT81554.1 putative ABC transporter ATP-binding protein [Gimesia maris]